MGVIGVRLVAAGAGHVSAALSSWARRSSKLPVASARR